MQNQLPDSSPGVPPIVLVIEDDRETCELYEAALGGAGLWVAHAADPAEALEYALDLMPDSVLMDVGIPTASDGLELARAFRQTAKTADIPLIAVAGMDAAALRNAPGLFTTVFYRPVDLPRLVRRVRWLSARSAVLRERSERVRARATPLIAKSAELLDRSRKTAERLSASLQPPAGSTSVSDSTIRSCPKCRTILLFSERRIVEGTTFDYYSPCRRGCGLFCFDHSRRTMITLVG